MTMKRQETRSQHNPALSNMMWGPFSLMWIHSPVGQQRNQSTMKRDLWGRHSLGETLLLSVLSCPGVVWGSHLIIPIINQIQILRNCTKQHSRFLGDCCRIIVHCHWSFYKIWKAIFLVHRMPAEIKWCVVQSKKSFYHSLAEFSST